MKFIKAMMRVAEVDFDDGQGSCHVPWSVLRTNFPDLCEAAIEAVGYKRERAYAIFQTYWTMAPPEAAIHEIFKSLWVSGSDGKHRLKHEEWDLVLRTLRS